MTLFWLLCALMVLAALAILLRPLLRQALAFAVTLAVLVPLLSVALYFQLGDPRVFDPAVQSVAQDADVELNPRYGRWDPNAASLLAQSGSLSVPAAEQAQQ